MPPRLDIPPELLAKGQYLYEETLTPVLEICALMGVSRSAFYARVLEGKWRRRHYCAGEVAVVDIENAPAEVTPQSEPPAAAANTPPAAPAGVTTERRAALYARAYRAAEQQMDTIECIQQTLRPTQAAQSERAVRTLAVLNKMLHGIMAMTKPDEEAPPDDSDDDAVPRDIDEFRGALARRIEAFIDARQRGARGADQGIMD